LKIVFWKVAVHVFPDREVSEASGNDKKVSGIVAEGKTVTGQRVRKNDV
jgi:hypothetical protein